MNLSGEDNIVSYYLSSWEFDLNFGSRKSIEFIGELMDSKHIGIFKAPMI